MNKSYTIDSIFYMVHSRDCLRMVYVVGKYRDVILPWWSCAGPGCLAGTYQGFGYGRTGFPKGTQAGFTQWDETGLKDG